MTNPQPFPPILGISSLEIEDLHKAHPTLAEAMSDFDPLHTSATFGGLLTAPELQSNCLRLEALSHFAVTFCRGKRIPPKKTVANWFSTMSSGPCGMYEDPSEDAFTSVIITPRGNFRVLGGIWESAAFFLQRIVNVVDGMPTEGDWNLVRESVYSLLTLSELICERAALARYSFGGEYPLKRLPKSLFPLQTYRERVTFSEADLYEHNLKFENLSSFIFDPHERISLAKSSLEHSPLLYQPLLYREGKLIVSVPTAISIAIRMFVVAVTDDGATQTLLKSLSHEFSRFFKENSPLNTGRRLPISFRPTAHGVMASYAHEVEAGRYLHVNFVLDTLEGFRETGFAGSNSDPTILSADVDHEIDECRSAICERQGFRDGLTLIVGCGIGRAQMLLLSNTKLSDWRTAYLSAADVAVLNSIKNIDPLMLWRILDAKTRLAQLGVQLDNGNVLLTLIAWVRSLDGHLIQHAQMPETFGGDKPCSMMIDASVVRSLRIEATLIDRHAEQTANGEWVEIRKTDESYFDSDRLLPLYVCSRLKPECGPEMVFLTAKRRWWCSVMVPVTLDRWMILHTWLPRIARVLDDELTGLPQGSLSLVVKFTGETLQYRNKDTICRDDIQREIRVKVDKAEGLVALETGQAFERGLAGPTNISEAALVHEIISGFLGLAGQKSISRAEALLNQIVPNNQARSCHAFYAAHFRDYVRDSLPSKPITVDAIDEATLRLGLGWNVRKREAGSSVEGKIACTSFLNDLVKFIEDSLCAKLKAFDRQSLVKLCLTNHEAGMQHQQLWRRTAAANLALRDDEAATLATITEQQFKNNAAMQASRILVELAVCECPVKGGQTPGDWDLSQLMAALLLANGFGGWSDAIHLDAMEPSLRIQALGDVHADQTFFDKIVEPFGGVSTGSMIRSSISNYSKNFEEPIPVEAVEPAFESEFVVAWQVEHGFGIDELRQFVDKIEDIGIKRKEAVFAMKRSELRLLLKDLSFNSSIIEQSMITTPRATWRTLPNGFNAKDIQPWRFRRRLSAIRHPIIQIDNADDPELVIAPGLLRDSIMYSLRGHYEGSFPVTQMKSRAMKSWVGEAARRRGTEFANDVAKRLIELGWRAQPEVDVTKILGMGFDLDYGDVDVLAWNPITNRVLFIECKDLHFHKTPSEIAEQLSDFRGCVRNGKRDLLKKHIDRCKVLEAQSPQVGSYLQLTSSPKTENYVVFRNPVPMLFDWKNLAGAVRIAIYEDLHQV